MRRRFGAAAVFLSAFVICQPGFAAENWPDSVDQYVAQVRKTIDTTDMEGYLAVVNHPNGALLVDVREETEFKAGHVPGTVNVSRGRLEFRIWKPLGYPGKVEMNRKIYVQCATGDRRPRHAGGQATEGYRLHQRYRRRDGIGRVAEEGISLRQGRVQIGPGDVAGRETHLGVWHDDACARARVSAVGNVRKVPTSPQRA